MLARFSVAVLCALGTQYCVLLVTARPQVTLVSDRKIEGDFQCLDKQGNLILGNSVEKTPDAQGKVDERLLGMVLIPKAQQKDVQIEVRRAVRMCRSI